MHHLTLYILFPLVAATPSAFAGCPTASGFAHQPWPTLAMRAPRDVLMLRGGAGKEDNVCDGAASGEVSANVTDISGDGGVLLQLLVPGYFSVNVHDPRMRYRFHAGHVVFAPQMDVAHHPMDAAFPSTSPVHPGLILPCLSPTTYYSFPGFLLQARAACVSKVLFLCFAMSGPTTFHGYCPRPRPVPPTLPSPTKLNASSSTLEHLMLGGRAHPLRFCSATPATCSKREFG